MYRRLLFAKKGVLIFLPYLTLEPEDKEEKVRTLQEEPDSLISFLSLYYSFKVLFLTWCFEHFRN